MIEVMESSGESCHDDDENDDGDNGNEDFGSSNYNYLSLFIFF